MAMQEITRTAFETLLDDDSYTWNDLAKLICERFPEQDIDEFIDMLYEYKRMREDGDGF